MSRKWCAAGLPLVALLCACIVDGKYRVRGTVLAERYGATEPLANAKVTVSGGGGSERVPGHTDYSDPDGAFQLEYRFGGMGFLFFWPDGNALLECTASGYQPVRLSVYGDETRPGVTREPCPGGEKRCYAFRIVLTPE